MALVKWDPFRELQQSINRLFEESWSQWSQRTGISPSAWTFPVDIQENEQAVIVKAEIPGMKKEDIKIHFVNNQLTIQGERKQETREEGTRFLKVERSYGNFYRSFALDIPVEQDKIKANYSDGVLEIVLPKKEETKPKQIHVE